METTETAHRAESEETMMETTETAHRAESEESTTVCKWAKGEGRAIIPKNPSNYPGFPPREGGLSKANFTKAVRILKKSITGKEENMKMRHSPH